MTTAQDIGIAILNAVRVVRPELGIGRLQPEMDLVQDFGLDGRRLRQMAELGSVVI